MNERAIDPYVAESEAFLRMPLPVAWLRTLRSSLQNDQRNPGVKLAGFVPRSLGSPVFIIGSPRSGTTFLGECFRSLRSCAYFFEPPFAKRAARMAHLSEWDEHRTSELIRIAYMWLAAARGVSHLRFVEKTPTNCFLVPVLKNAFPDAKFIYIVRDGRDAAVSYSKKPWCVAESLGSKQREPGGYLYGPYPRFWVERGREREFFTTSNIHRSIWVWRSYVEHAEKGLNRLDPGDVLRVRYESLIREKDRYSSQILDFLRIDEQSLRESFRSAVEQGTDRSIGTWRRELGAGEMETIEREAGRIMASYGYT